MMFLDGPQTKVSGASTVTNHHHQKTTTNDEHSTKNTRLPTSAASELRSRISVKLSNFIQSELKDDLAKSLARLRQATSGHRGEEGGQQQRQGGRKGSSGANPSFIPSLKNIINNNNHSKSATKASNTGASGGGGGGKCLASRRKSTCTAINDKILATFEQQPAKSAAPSAASRRPALGLMRSLGSGSVDQSGQKAAAKPLFGNGPRQLATSSAPKRAQLGRTLSASSGLWQRTMAGVAQQQPPQQQHQQQRRSIFQSTNIGPAGANTNNNNNGSSGRNSYSTLGHRQLIQQTKRRLKGDLAYHVNKCDSWLNSARKQSLSTILFIISLGLFAFFTCLTLPLGAAPVPLPQVTTMATTSASSPPLRPIWLQEVLMSLDPPGSSYSWLPTSTLMTTDADDSPARGTDESGEDENGEDAAYAANGGQFDRIFRQFNQVAEGQGEPMAQQQQAFYDQQAFSGRGNGFGRMAGPQAALAPEIVWIERRRLDRDRALEPPPWLREQPMRRGFSPAMVENDGSSAEPEEKGELDGEPQVDSGEGTTSNGSSAAAAAASGQTSSEKSQQQQQQQHLGRHSRQSAGEIYEEILKQLVEGTLDSQELLDGLYDEMKVRGKQQLQQQPAPLINSEEAMLISQSDGAPTSNSASLAQQQLQQQQQQLAQQQQQALNQAAVARQLNDRNNFQDQSGSGAQYTDADATLVVVGDDVGGQAADELLSPAAGTGNGGQQRSASALGQMRAAYMEGTGKGVGGTTRLASGDQNNGDFVADVDDDNEMASSPGRLAKPTISRQLDPATVGAQFGRQSSSLPGSFSKQQQQIYIADGSEQASNLGLLKQQGAELNLDGDSDGQQQQQQQADGGQLSDVGSDTAAAGSLGQQLASFHVIEDIDQADGTPLQETPSVSGIGIPEAEDLAQQQAYAAAATGQAEEWLGSLAATGGGQPTAARAASQPMKRSVAISARRKQSLGPTELPMGAAVAAAPLRAGQPSAASDPSPAMVMMIESEYPNKDGLALAANKLKSYLERMIDLPSESILGLYPLGTDYLLIKLDTGKLSPYEKLNMIRKYNFVDGFIMVKWPSGSQHSPVPLLSAILQVLALKSGGNVDDETDTTPAAAVAAAPLDYLPATEEEEQQAAADLDSSAGGGDQLTLVRPLVSNNNNNNINGRAKALQQQQQPTVPLMDTAFDQAFRQATRHQGELEWSLAPHPAVMRTSASLVQADELAANNVNRLVAQYLRSAPATSAERIPAAALLSYLGSTTATTAATYPRGGGGLWAGGEVAGFPGLLADGRQPAPAALPLQYGGLGRASSAASRSTNDNLQRQSHESIYNLHVAHLLALLAALCGACLAFKLMMRNSDKQILRRRFGTSGSFRSLWSGSTSLHSDGGLVTGQGDKQSELEASNPSAVSQKRRRLSNEKLAAAAELKGSSGECCATETSDERKSLDLLAQKLVKMLNPAQLRAACRHQQRHSPATATDSEEPAGGGGSGDATLRKISSKLKSKEVDEMNAPGCPEILGQELDDDIQQPGRFRSSRHYIKSLIDALSKARAQFPSGGGQLAPNNDDERYDSSTSVSHADNLDQVATSGNNQQLDGSLGEEQQQQQQLRQPQQEPGILMSQMDITAAHLILAYMEKHLEDKERLRREWLELNATTAGGSVSSKGASAAKISQIMLQRLAKTALSEENRAKNRNCLVLPFDRNRVKLGHSSGGSGGASATSASQTQPLARAASGRSQQQHRGAPMTGTKGSVGQQTTAATTTAAPKSDYINASYIYDDDPRTPTHIIAQGPSEQTCGQFWQMIWEQGISVIVMLTRLNENSVTMCHCYWPTNASQQQQRQSSTSAASSSGDSSPPTSVAISAAAAAANGQPAARQPALGGPAAAMAATAAAAESASANGNGGNGGQPTAKGRRGSVTSVFNPADSMRGHGNGQPIIANCDLTNNVLIFEINQSAPDAAANEQTAAQNGCTTSSATTRLEVHLVSEHVSSGDYLVRNMYLINRSSGETRTITQFHYLAWPEQGVPENVRSLLQFRRKVHKSYRNLKSPILVHCSDGAGRSGTYCLIDIILERIKNGAKEIDPRATLEHLRDQRTGLCATQSQFEFVLVALAEEIQIILNALPQ